MRLSRQKHRRRGRAGMLNLPAMIDVVMLLLIFFMATSSFTRPERLMDSSVAGVGSAGPLKDFEPVFITVGQAGTDVIYICEGMEYGTLDQLADRLGAYRAIADMDVVVRSEDAVRFEDVVAVLDVCAQLGFTKTALAGGDG